MKLTKIIINTQFKTSDEQVEELIKATEDHLDTGPIIGEKREAIAYLARNILIRDIMIGLLNLNENAKYKMFNDVEKIMEKRDRKILKERKKKGK